MIRRWVLCGIFQGAALCSCSTVSEPVSKCESILLPSLKAPASYKRIEQTVGLVERGRQSVFITYDAVNSYNAPIRDVFSCVYTPATQTAEPAEVAADDLSMPDNTAQAEGADNELSLAAPDELDEVPVCDRPDSAAKRKLMKEIGVNCLGE